MPDSIIKADNITGLTTAGVGIPDGTVAAPGLKFTNDGDSGLYRIGANDVALAVGGAKAIEADPNTVSIYTGGSERFRIESTGQIKAVYESQVGTDYNTTLHNGYLCRAWVQFSMPSTTNASGNFSSITSAGAGAGHASFTVAMPDANYCAVGSANNNTSDANWLKITNRSTIQVNYEYTNSVGGNLLNLTNGSIAVFR